MNRLAQLRTTGSRTARGQRADAPANLPFQDWVDLFRFQGLSYPVINQTLAGIPQQEISPEFYGFSEQAYKANPIVFAVVATRMKLFSQARFAWKPKTSINLGDLTTSPALSLLEQPWPNGSTGDLLKLISLWSDLAGNAYMWRNNGKIWMPRPDWMTIVLGTERADGKVGDIDTQVLGYIYKPPAATRQTLLAEEVAHFKPQPDPIFPWRGMSWIQPLLEEVQADNGASAHKRMFFEHAATPNMVVNFSSQITPEDFNDWVDKFEEGHKGVLHAYKTLYLAGGADAKVVGSNLEQMDFKVVQAHGETRICLAGGVPAIVVGVSEGLDAGTYHNFGQALRSFGDLTARGWWQGVCECLSPLVSVPSGSILWYDEAQIPFLQPDLKDRAAYTQQQGSTIRNLIDAGFKPDSAVRAVQTGNLDLLQHTGLYSVQLQPPGTEFTPTALQKNEQARAAALALGTPPAEPADES